METVKFVSINYLVSKIASKIDDKYYCNQQDITEYVEQAKKIYKDETEWQLSWAIALYLKGHSFSEIVNEKYKELYKQDIKKYSREEVFNILDKFLESMLKGEKTGLIEEWFDETYESKGSDEKGIMTPENHVDILCKAISSQTPKQ